MNRHFRTKIRAIVEQDILHLPRRKIFYSISTGLIEGFFKNLSNYGIEYNEEVHDYIVELVQEHLTGSSDIEYEWSEEEYNNFVKYKGEV